MSVLGSYLGSMPPLPTLVLTHLPTSDKVYQFPANAPIVAPSVLKWLKRVEAGNEKPAGRMEEREEEEEKGEGDGGRSTAVV